MNRKGFTIVELVVVMAIVLIAGAIAMPVVQHLRESARETVCSNNVRQLNLALSQYGETVEIPPFNAGGTISGWSIDVLPFLDQNNLKQALPVNQLPGVLAKEHFVQPSIFRCPTQTASRNEPDDEIAPAHYVLVADPIAERVTYSIADAPDSFMKPWVVSPEVESFEELKPGPHRGSGYFYAHGFQYDVQFSER